MIVRRLIALLTSVTMLHLSMVAGDSACATHGANGHHAARTTDAAATEHTMPMDGHVMPVGAASAPMVSALPTAATDTAPCEVPVQQHCCEAQVACSAANAVASVRQDLATAIPHVARIRDTRHDAPASYASAPEPPPPKA